MPPNRGIEVKPPQEVSQLFDLPPVPDDSPALIATTDLLHKVANEFTRGLITRQEYLDRCAFITMEHICEEAA